ncbi:MAG: hypothetical protein ACLVC1_10810 [Mediterraneibacter gnavus]
MGNRNAEGKVPVSNWKKYLKNATEEKETLEAEKKEVLEKLRPLQKVQRSVDLVMMEIEDQLDPENFNLQKKKKQHAGIRFKKDRVKEKIIWSGIIGGTENAKIYRRTDSKSK